MERPPSRPRRIPNIIVTPGRARGYGCGARLRAHGFRAVDCRLRIRSERWSWKRSFAHGRPRRLAQDDSLLLVFGSAALDHSPLRGATDFWGIGSGGGASAPRTGYLHDAPPGRSCVARRSYVFNFQSTNRSIPHPPFGHLLPSVGREKGDVGRRVQPRHFAAIASTSERTMERASCRSVSSLSSAS